MNYFNQTIILILLVIVTACNPNKKPQNIPLEIGGVLSISDTLNIVIPDSIPSPSSRSNFSWNSNNKYLGFRGDVTIDVIPIYIYEFQNKKWRVLNLNVEGPNQVYGTGEFAFNGDNSIFYFPSNPPRLLKIDFDGNILANKKFSEQYLHAYNTTVFNPGLLQKGSKLGFLSTEYLNMDEEENYKTARLYTIYDFESNEAEHIINFPEEFHGDIWSPNDQMVTSIYKDGEIILNFSKSHSLYVYDTKGLMKRKVNLRVKEIGDAEPTKANSDYILSMINSESTGQYTSLIYDKWRKVFYRIGKYYNSDLKPSNLDELRSISSKLSFVVVTLNSDLDVLGVDHYSKLDDGVEASSYFVNEKGLYIQLEEKTNNLISYLQLKLESDSINN